MYAYKLPRCRVSDDKTDKAYQEAAKWTQTRRENYNPLPVFFKKKLRERGFTEDTALRKKLEQVELMVLQAGEKEWEEFPEITCALPRNTSVVCKVSLSISGAAADGDAHRRSSSPPP